MIVATSIGEEGLDIMEVDLVVCFDANISPLRMTQRMGRTGRKNNGRVDILFMRLIFILISASIHAITRNRETKYKERKLNWAGFCTCRENLSPRKTQQVIIYNIHIVLYITTIFATKSTYTSIKVLLLFFLTMGTYSSL